MGDVISKVFATAANRRSVLLGAPLVSAWAASPWRSLAQAAEIARPEPSPRLTALLARMTVEEKAGQLTLMPSTIGGNATAFNPAQLPAGMAAQLAEVRAGRLTGLFNNRDVRGARQFQEVAVKESRLAIPLIFGADVIHGFRTIFPVPLAEAASFDADLCERTARAAAAEATAQGAIDWNFAPMVDIARDARWGRVVEGAGEDVLLGQRLAAARVRGFQGRSLSDPDAVLACVKHFAAYGAAEAGLDYNVVDVSEHTLREVYLPPFKAAFDAGALSTMSAFNELSGVPTSGNSWLTDQLLRKEWGFGGLVVSDYASDLELVNHGFAADAREAAKLAFLAGVDMSMASGIYMKHLPDLVAKGEVPMARLDQAVLRVLLVKERLGLFDDPYRRMKGKPPAAGTTGPAAHVALAREAAQRSIVLLKNEGEVLPLAPAGKRIALIGPFGEGQRDLVGPWTVFGLDRDAVDLATGIRAALRDPALLTVVKGSDVTAAIDGGITAAVAAARNADVVLLAIGESQGMSGEAQSRTDIVVPKAQQDLAEAVAAVGKPVVVVLKNGRPLALEGAVLAAPAIVVTWFLGTQGGHAIADILFGKASPSGRLPVSFPRAAGQVPYYDAHKATGRPNGPGRLNPYKTHYIGVPNSALFPFGHGLTYGKVAYSDFAVSERGGGFVVSATVTNSGSRVVDELVQLYVQDVAATLTRPVRELKEFRSVKLAPGKAQRVEFVLGREQLAYLGADLRKRTDPGLFRAWIASSAEAEGAAGTFTLA
jgi:beta-glucosidase